MCKQNAKGPQVVICNQLRLSSARQPFLAFLPRARLESASLREALVHSDLETWEGDGESLNLVNQDPEAEVRRPGERAIARPPPPNRL